MNCASKGALDGYEVLHRIHAADAHLPVLMLTAKDAPADQVRGLEDGADDYVTKPFTCKPSSAPQEWKRSRWATPGHNSW